MIRSVTGCFLSTTHLPTPTLLKSHVTAADNSRNRRVSSRLSRFVAGDVASSSHKKTPSTLRAWGLLRGLGGWGVGGQGNRPASPNARILNNVKSYRIDLSQILGARRQDRRMTCCGHAHSVATWIWIVAAGALPLSLLRQLCQSLFIDLSQSPLRPMRVTSD
jgi:hypothetical protein